MSNMESMLDKKDIPCIKTFIENKNYFCYDTYSNRLFLITKKHFEELRRLQIVGVSSYRKRQSNSTEHNDIIRLLRGGYFLCSDDISIENIEEKYVKWVMKRCVSELTLQVTKDCNFMCRYCAFAIDNHIERMHTNENMTWEIAKAGVDFLFSHSSDCEKIAISFYGGEPLLAFSLIKKVVEYAESLFVTKPIKYLMTTNGSIINEEISDFLNKYQFKLAISFDGPKTIQDFHRKRKFDGKETFEVVSQTVFRLRKRYPDYFEKSVSFFSVIFDDENENDVFNFFQTNGINEEKVRLLYADLSGVDYKFKPGDNNAVEMKKNSFGSNIKKEVYNRFLPLLKDKRKIPSVWHHNGPCIPTLERLFLTTNGCFYVCEKTVESKNNILGNIHDGIDINNVCKYLNIGKLSADECKHCWAKRFCSICALYCYDCEKDCFSSEKKAISCERMKDETLRFLKSIAVESLR